MRIQAHKDLQQLHTFGVPWQATVFCAIDSVEDAVKTVRYAIEYNMPMLVLGGGSNMLPTVDYPGLVIKNELGGRSVIDINEQEIILHIGAGENWHDLVMWTVESGYYGLENLALIPGTVGGAVVQNIGAYDVDLGRFIERVECIDLGTGEEKIFESSECGFGYRTSVFKENQGRWMVTGVTLRLAKQFVPVVPYKPLQEKLGDSVSQLSATDVMNAVIEIRQSKLPDWNMVGTAGSFFGNPRLTDEQIRELQARFPDMPVFNNYGTGKHTVPAGWLIEQSGIDGELKNKYLYPKHHLIVVNNTKNTDQTSGQEIAEFTRLVQQQVREMFGVELTPEVVVLI